MLHFKRVRFTAQINNGQAKRVGQSSGHGKCVLVCKLIIVYE